MKSNNDLMIRCGLALAAVTCLATMYLFQRVNWISHLVGGSTLHPYLVFVLNKTIRFLINDLACIILIKVLFQEAKFMKLAWQVFWLEILIVLPIYFFIKLSIEGESELSSPFLSQIHRLIVNPILMIVLMAAFYYQRILAKTSK